MIKLSKENKSFNDFKNTSIPKWLLLLIGFFALIWVLIRVIPKPSRINYTCQKLAFPLAFFFLSWVGGIIASLNIKHYMGIVSDKLTNETSHSTVDEGDLGRVMAETRVPVLNITDAKWVNAQRGPSTPYSRAINLGIIAASTDPIALDYRVSKNLLAKVAINIGNKYGSNNMDPENIKKGSFGSWLRLSMN